MSHSDQIHERINQLLQSEEEHVRKIIIEAISLAQTYKHRSADRLSTMLQRDLDKILKGD